jgi:hypothetical protein
MCLKACAALVVPEAGSFKLLTPPEGLDALTDYTFNTNQVHYRFCPKCGIRCFMKGVYQIDGRELEVSRIYVATIDEREDGEAVPELKDIKVKYFANRDEKKGSGRRGLGDEPYERGMW